MGMKAGLPRLFCVGSLPLTQGACSLFAGFKGNQFFPVHVSMARADEAYVGPAKKRSNLASGQGGEAP